MTMIPRTTAIRLATVATALVGTSCIDLNLPTGDSLLPKPSFIMTGVMDVDPASQLCSVLHGDDGVDYHLFQGPRLTNDEYDQLFEDGARIRLEIEERRDLTLDCRMGKTVEVVEVLEFIPAP